MKKNTKIGIIIFVIVSVILLGGIGYGLFSFYNKKQDYKNIFEHKMENKLDEMYGEEPASKQNDS